jgi:tRNA A37 threonylcarbamoyladenosine synthetase subunit TsaC/SUA5/YrdC
LGTTLILPGDEEPLTDPEDVRDRLAKLVDLVIDGGACGLQPTTVIDMTEAEPVLRRHGRGDVTLFGL